MRSGVAGAAERSGFETRAVLGTLVLLGVASVLVVTHAAIAALSLCLNETPDLSAELRLAVPVAAQAAQGVLRLLGQSGVDGGCDPSAPARFMAIAGAAYVVGIVVLDRGFVRARTQWVMVLLAAAVMQALLFFMPGLLSSDILDYASHGRVAAIHASNPYLVAPLAFPNDPFAHQGAWPGAVTVYGPLWTDIDAAITRVFAVADRVQLAFAYKAVGLLSNVAILYLIWWIAKTWQTSPGVAVAMWAWNPLANLEMVGSAHNEGVMTVFVLLALVLLSTRRAAGMQPLVWLAALACLGLGALIKFVPAAVAAMTGLLWLRGIPTRMRRVRTGLVAAAVLVLMSLAAAWPWLDSPAVAEPLVSVAAGGQRFKDVWQDAPAAWLTVRVVPLLGVPDDPPTLRMDVARSMVWAVTRVVFVIYLAFEAWSLLRSPDSAGIAQVRRIALASLRCLLLAILLFVSQVYAWYFLWPLPMACLLGWREPWSKAAVLFGLTFLVAFYLREFQPYGVFYVPIYALVALAALAMLWRAERTPALAYPP